MDDTERSKKHEEARAALPLELHTAFDDLVADYQFLGMKHYNRPFVSYLILADLVREGWRRSEEQKKT
jgi:hypothetical protein